MDTILHNAKCWLTTDGRLEVYDHKLATILNKTLETYERGNYRFKEGEEAVFLVPQNQLNRILSQFLNLKRAQTNTP